MQGWNDWAFGFERPLWQAADVGASVRLQDGRSLWVFGDTLRAEGERPRLVSNSMLVTSGDCTSQVVTPSQGPVIPDSPTGSVCWPASVAARPQGAGNQVLVGCSRIQRGDTGGGLLSFTYLGLTLATFDVGPGGAPVLAKTVDVTPDNPDVRQVNWGTALLVDQGYLYVYGTRAADAGGARALLVARTTFDQAIDRRSWRYWNGTGWGTAEGAAAPVIDGTDGVSQALSVSRIGNRYVAVSKVGGDFGDRIGEWTAPSPRGPWRLAASLPVPPRESDGVITYQPLAHPEQRLASGKLLVSMSRLPEKLDDLAADARKGRLRFYELPRP